MKAESKQNTEMVILQNRVEVLKGQNEVEAQRYQEQKQSLESMITALEKQCSELQAEKEAELRHL